MKTKAQKRLEAIERAKNAYIYQGHDREAYQNPSGCRYPTLESYLDIFRGKQE